jgi:hypothetical protein
MVEPSYRTFLEYDVSSGNWLWESKTATRIASRPLNLWAAALGRCSYGQHNRPVEGARMGSFGQCGRSGFLIVQRQTPNPASNGRRTPGRKSPISSTAALVATAAALAISTFIPRTKAIWCTSISVRRTRLAQGVGKLVPGNRTGQASEGRRHCCLESTFYKPIRQRRNPR